VGDGLGGVDVHERARRVGGVGQQPDVVERPEDVRHGRDRQQLRTVEQPVEVGEVELEVVGDGDPAELDAALFDEDVPRHDIGVMLHLGDDHRIAGAEVLAGPGVRDEVHRLGDVLREDDLARSTCVEQLGHLGASSLVGGCRLLRDRVDAAVHVRVVVAVVVLHGVEHGTRLLRRRRRVEVHERLAVDLAFEDREVGLDSADVENLGHPPTSAVRKASKPSRSRLSASSRPPEATMRPPRRMCTASGVRCSRIRR
jgi:hypothetical protein